MSCEVPATKKLARWLKDLGHTQAALAEMLGTSQPTVSSWVRGTSRPDPVFQMALERVTKGTVLQVDWLTAAERKLLQRVA